MRVSANEILRASFGALIGVLITGFVTSMALGPTGVAPILIAPVGASAVLLFAVPSSPFAQPWPLIGGNTIAAVIGVTIAGLIADPILAAALAASLAIAAMYLTQTLHPPSGAVALTAVLGGPAVLEIGYGFVIWPVAVNSVLLLLAATAFNKLIGRAFPARSKPVGELQHVMENNPLMVSSKDVETVLRSYDEIVDVSPQTLDHLINQAQILAYQRKAGRLTCEAIMSPVPVTVRPQMPLRAAWSTLRRHQLRAVAVVDEEVGLVGILSKTDFFAAGVLDRFGRVQGFGRRARRVQDIMTRNVQSALPETPIARLVPPMAQQGLHQIPIVNAHNRVVGMVTQTDLIGGLFRCSLEAEDVSAAAA